MEASHWDLPLAIIVAMMLVDKGITWSKYLIGRVNGNPGKSASGQIERLEKRMDTAGAKMSDLTNLVLSLPDKLRAEWHEDTRALRDGQQVLHDRVTDVSERTARLEGRH